MEPSRYRKAYEAMLHASQLMEMRMSSNTTDGVEEEESDRNGIGLQDEPDCMDWTPTEATTPPNGCGPPSTAATNMRHLLSDAGDGEYTIEERGENGVVLHKLQEDLIMDQCIDQLVRDLPDVLNYENSSTFTPSTIEVPKDFGLQLSISINHHLAQVADRKILEKYRRLLGHRKDPAKKKQIRLGFDPNELIKRHAVSFPKDASARESTLDNDIHPIFRADNFHGCSDEIYATLKPALRLSTLLLFSRATSIFWHTLVWGKRKPCQQTSELYGQPCFRIHEDVDWTAQHEASFRSFVDQQVDTVHFMFHRDPLPPNPAYASMGLVNDYKNGLMRKMDQKCHTSRICLHSDFYTTAKKLSLLQYPEPAMVLRFNLFLAVCIAHEMAHFIEVSGPHHEHPLGEPEVFFNDNEWTESGIAFELKIFGGRLHPISSRVDCGLGLAVLSYPLRKLYDKEDNVLYTLPMDYITKVQQKETWEQDFKDTAKDIFHVPRTGCRSIEVNGTNLMVWEDEKDADISDHIDGKDTMFYRMDDGQIVRNPHSNNRKPQRQPEARRWSPYGHKRTKTADTPPSTDGEVVKTTEIAGKAEVGKDEDEGAIESAVGPDDGVGIGVGSDDDMTEEQLSEG